MIYQHKNVSGCQRSSYTIPSIKMIKLGLNFILCWLVILYKIIQIYKYDHFVLKSKTISFKWVATLIVLVIVCNKMCLYMLWNCLENAKLNDLCESSYKWYCVVFGYGNNTSLGVKTLECLEHLHPDMLGEYFSCL